jgi:hypothetical protein
MDMVFLQLADFAAFTINRMQWLLAKRDRTDKDNALLQVLREAQLNVINLQTVPVDLANWAPGRLQGIPYSGPDSEGFTAGARRQAASPVRRSVARDDRQDNT